ncbi:MAG: class I SAM-dependent methyltransferase [Rhizomicrobium sp.]|jgi:SAM-dependent methyltransferase
MPHSYDVRYSQASIAASRHFAAEIRFCLKLAGVQHPRTVLDLGGGTGAHSLILQDMGFDVTLLDSSPIGVEKAKAAGVRRAIEGDFFADPLRNEKFDVVLARSFSGFNTDQPAFFADTLARVGELVAPGGVLIYWSWTDCSGQWSDRDTSSGGFSHTPRSIDGLFDRLLLVPKFHVLARAPIGFTLAANRILRALPAPLPKRVTLLGLRNRPRTQAA